MAANQDALSCGVCFHPYSDNDSQRKSPRLLPCSHTICHGCYLNLTGITSVTCPFCRKSGSTSRENPYVMAHLREKRELEKRMRQEREDWEKQRIEENERMKQKENEKLDVCGEHGKEENLFCENSECQKPICSLCLIRNHRRHEVVDLEEVQESKRQECLQENTILEHNAVMFQEKIQGEYEENISQAQQHQNKLLSIKDRVVKEITRKFDDLYEEIFNNRKDYDHRFETQRNARAAVSERVKSSSRRIKNFTGSFYKNLLHEETTHKRIKKDLNKLKKEKRVFTFQRYRESAHFGEADLERMCGTLVAETIEGKEDDTDPAKAEEKNTDETEAGEGEVENTEEAEQNDDGTNMEEIREANDERNAAAVDGNTDDGNYDRDLATVLQEATRVAGLINKHWHSPADEDASTSCSPSKRIKTS